MPADLANSLKADEDRKSDHTTLVQVKEEKVVTHAATTETKLQWSDLGVGVDSLSEIQTCVAPAEIWLRDDLEKSTRCFSGSSGTASGWRSAA